MRDLVLLLLHLIATLARLLGPGGVRSVNVGLRAKKRGKRLPRAIGKPPTHRRWQLAPDWTRISGPGLEGLIPLTY